MPKSKSLVLIESPGKIKSFKKYLGDGYNVEATFGHCIDLPAKGISVNIKKDFEPTFAVNPDKKDVMKSLLMMTKKSSAVYLMMDPDREGSGIARNLYEELKSTGVPIYRAASNEITSSKIKEAISNATAIEQDEDNYNAYLCRRILDRIVGYKTSFLTQQATGGKSAGRVQSAMLRIISEREKEIINFTPEEYWVLTADFIGSKGDLYTGVLDEKIKVPNAKKATEIYDKVTKGSPIVSLVESKEVTIAPYAPFVTATLIQSGSTILGWTAEKTMKVAQKLYENSFISYMRTDSPSMSKEAISSVRKYIEHDFGNKYLIPTVKMYSKKGSQEGHECCRPTKIEVSTASTGDEQKLYNLIWRRTIASQMVPGKDKRLKVVTKCGGYDFISRGNARIFDGFRKCWNYGKKDDILLPNLSENEKVKLKQLIKEQKWTVPPPRYSDASLSKKCETSQITRPATFASFLKTLANRGYIKRIKKSFHATELGIRVVDFLVAAGMCFVDLKFTAKMEQQLDEVASGSKDKLEVLSKFWDNLKSNIETGKKIKDDWQLTDHICPKCKGKLRRKHSKFGPFYSCENYSKKEDDGCSYIANVGENGEPIEKVVKPKVYAKFACNACGGKMIKRQSSYGEFCGCENFPKCRATSDLDGNFKEPKTNKFSKFKKFKKTGAKKSKKGKKKLK